MEISSLNNQQVISSLTVGQLEVIVTQIVQKVISKQQESLIPDEYKQPEMLSHKNPEAKMPLNLVKSS